MATIAVLIETAREKLAVVLAAGPNAYVDYQVGDKTFKRKEYVHHLLDTIERLSKIDATESDLDFVQFDFDFDEIGHDQTQRTVL